MPSCLKPKLSISDEIVEPRQDMNIKVAPFIESKKFYYTNRLTQDTWDLYFCDKHPILMRQDSGEPSRPSCLYTHRGLKAM